MILLAYAIALLLPLLFLYLIYAQDLYGQGKFGFVLLSFGWGLAAFGASYGVEYLLNRGLSGFVRGMSPATITILWFVVLAPIVEELLKSALLPFLARQMTYFVDGAIYGFASGIAFSVLENVLYLARLGRGGAGAAGLMALLRALSTCLMHGTTSALVGTAIGRFRYGRGAGRFFSAILGGTLAIGLHMLFNWLVSGGGRAKAMLLPLLGALGIGVGGAVLIILFIRWGLAEEKRWIGETLGIRVGVTKGEVAVVRQYEQIDELLQPVVERFGEEKAELVEQFLLKQAHLGIKRKARALSQDPREQERLDAEIPHLHEEMEALRRQVGVYCMIYVRSIIPLDEIDLTSIVERQVQRMAETGRSIEDADSLQQTLAMRMAQRGLKKGRVRLWGTPGEEEQQPDE